MPCSSDGYRDETTISNKRYRTLRDAEALLCAVLTKHGEKLLEGIDYTEAGVSRANAYGWWEDHQKKDRERRLREAEEKKRQQTKKAALSKLSAEERKVLGL